MKKEELPKICPRCKKNELDPVLAMNVLSRLDNETYICSGCGSEEAFDAYLASFGGGHSER